MWLTDFVAWPGPSSHYLPQAAFTRRAALALGPEMDLWQWAWLAWLPWLAAVAVGAGYHVRRPPSRLHGRLLAGAAAADPPSREVMSFGNRVDIQITLPSRDVDTVSAFLQDEARLLDATWEPTKYRVLPSQQDRRSYMLLFPELVLPGVDTISPEVEVQFQYKEGCIRMTSGNWTLRGLSGNVLKDSRFVQTFNIVVQGELGIVAVAGPGQLAPSPIVAKGWVEYMVSGEKPSVFKSAPPFVLDVTIKLIQETVSEFATNQFSTRLLRGFRSFVMARVALGGR